MEEKSTIDKIFCDCGFTLKNYNDYAFTDDEVLKLFSHHVRLVHFGGVEQIAIKRKVVN